MGKQSAALLFEYKGIVRGVDFGLNPVLLLKLNEIAEQMGGCVASVCIGHNLNRKRLKKRGASRAPHIRLQFRSRRSAERLCKINWTMERDTRVRVFKSGDRWFASISRTRGSLSLAVKQDWWNRTIGVLSLKDS